MPSDSELRLFEHQVEGIAWLKEHQRALLADEPGLGKSAQALLAVRQEPVLIVAPAMVLASGTWDDEIAKWSPNLEVTQVAYSSLSARERTKGDIRPGTRPTGRVRSSLESTEWKTVIADEAHYLKGRKTKWTEAFKRLVTGNRNSDRYLIALTGTPVPNWAHEAFMLLQLLRPGDRRWTSYWRWAGEWFDCAPTKWSPMAVGNLRTDRTWDEWRKENWGDLMLQRLRDECLDLPPVTEQWMRVKMTMGQRRVYQALKKDFIAWLDSGVEVTVWNAAAQMTKLLQVATGLEVVNPEDKGSGKLDALEDLLRDRPLPTLVVGHFRETINQAVERARKAGTSAGKVSGEVPLDRRTEAIRAFQRGELNVLVATLETISEGMTLVAADQIIFLERSWKPSKNEQALRRIHRIGQERPVTAIHLVTEDSADSRVIELLLAKTDQQMQALGRTDLRSVV